VLWPQLAERLELDVRDGALIQEVEPDSPAEQAGLRAGICMMPVPALIREVRASTQAIGLTASLP
jgi:S1-C subfamily serine protease